MISYQTTLPTNGSTKTIAISDIIGKTVSNWNIVSISASLSNGKIYSGVNNEDRSIVNFGAFRESDDLLLKNNYSGYNNQVCHILLAYVDE